MRWGEVRICGGEREGSAECEEWGLCRVWGVGRVRHRLTAAVVC